MKAIEQIIATLNTAFAQYDAKHEEDSVEWAKGRCAALVEYKQSDDYAERSKKGAWGGQFDKMFAIAGGKTWFNVFRYGFNAQVEAFVRKNAKATCEKRNATIAVKLVKAEIEQLESAEVVRSDDGFDGVFTVRTAGGVQKRVTINTIYAGGYNIQCLHQRTLVKVK